MTTPESKLRRIIRKYPGSGDLELTPEQLDELKQWVRCLRLRVRTDVRGWIYDPVHPKGRRARTQSEVFERFSDMRCLLLHLKHHRLRAAYWEEVCQLRRIVEHLWSAGECWRI